VKTDFILPADVSGVLIFASIQTRETIKQLVNNNDPLK